MKSKARAEEKVESGFGFVVVLFSVVSLFSYFNLNIHRKNCDIHLVLCFVFYRKTILDDELCSEDHYFPPYTLIVLIALEKFYLSVLMYTYIKCFLVKAKK